LVLFVRPAAAQPDVERSSEFFAGFSVMKASYEAEPPDLPMPVIVAFEPDQTLYGFNGSYARYLGTSGFALKADVSAHFKKSGTPDPLGGEISTRIGIYNLLGGAQYKFARAARVSPFLHGLAGVAHTRAKISIESLSSSETLSSTDFALAFGGGIDVLVNERFDLRVIQVDYNPVFLRDGNELGFGKTRADNYRFSFGVVFR